MKHIFILLIGSSIILSLASCKKGYTCACSSESGFYDGFDIKENKKRAEQKCDQYYKSNYENRLPDSTANIGTVHCELSKNE